ncbi:MAG: hypothetical protein WCK34_11015 [Bacteroidota bacterium]
MKKEIIKYLIGRFIPAIVVVAVVILAIRFLGPVEYGKYSLLLYTALLTITLSFHWVQVSILRFMGGLPRESGEMTSRFFDLTLFSALFSTIIVILAGTLYFHLSLQELVMVSLFAFLNHFYLFHQAILQAYHRSVRMAILEGVEHLLIIIVLISGLFFFHWRSSLLLFGSLAAGLGGALIIRTIIREKGLLMVDLTHLYWDSRFSGKVIGFGYGVALWLFFSHLLMSADRFIIMEHLGYRDAGMYSALKDLLYKGVTFAILPIYISYQAKICDQWNAKHNDEAWKTIKEALSFEMLILILVFIIFMVGKQMLFNDLLKIPDMDSWLVYLPLLISAFLWQAGLLIQRFLELTFKYGYILIAMGLTVLLNILLNLIFVPRYGLIASSLSLLVTTVFYSGFLLVVAMIVEKKIEL